MSAGRVYLVGAGPGDPGLLTARALELIASADVILHDRLIPAGALAGARDGRRARLRRQGGRRRAGAAGGDDGAARRARARGPRRRPAEGRRPVRLRPRRRGGRGAAGRGRRRSRSCPGVTAGIAAPAYAGIPVTQRDVASAVAFVTGHEDPAKPEHGDRLAGARRFPGTLVFYMGVRAAAADRRPAHRRRPAGRRARGRRRARHAPRPARRRGARWPTMAEAAAAAGIRAPAITVVGRGRRAARRARLVRGPPARRRAGWRSRAPARRPAAWPGGCAELGRRGRRGAGDPDPAARGRDARRRGLRPRVPDQPERRASSCRRACRDARALAGATVAAIGPGTARALRERGIEADIVPERFVAEGLVEALADVPVRRALIARGRRGPRRPPRRPARARRRGRRRRRSTRPSPSRCREAERGRRPGRRLRHLHLVLDRALLPRRRRARPDGAAPGLDRAGDERDAARARARAARRGRAARHRRPRRRAARRRAPDAMTAVIVTFLTDYGRDDEFVGICHAVIAADRARGPGHRRHARDPAPRHPRRRASCCATRSPICPRRAPRRRGSRGGDRAARRSPCAPPTDRLFVGPDNGLLAAGARGRRRRGRGRGHRALAPPARAGVGHVPRPRPLRPGRRPPGRGRDRWPRPGSRSAVDGARRRSSCRGRSAATERSSPTPCSSTATATCSSTPATRTSPATGLRLGRGVVVEAGERVEAPATRATFADVAAGRAAALRGRSPARWRSRSTAATRAERLGVRSGDAAVAAARRRDRARLARASTCARPARRTSGRGRSPRRARRTARSSPRPSRSAGRGPPGADVVRAGRARAAAARSSCASWPCLLPLAAARRRGRRGRTRRRASSGRTTCSSTAARSPGSWPRGGRRRAGRAGDRRERGRRAGRPPARAARDGGDARVGVCRRSRRRWRSS